MTDQHHQAHDDFERIGHRPVVEIANDVREQVNHVHHVVCIAQRRPGIGRGDKIDAAHVHPVTWHEQISVFGQRPRHDAATAMANDIYDRHAVAQPRLHLLN